MPLIEHVLTEELMGRMTDLDRECCLLFLNWIASGTTTGLKTQDDERPVITFQQGLPILMLETRRWSPMAQTYWWKARPWGGQNTHIAEAFSRIITTALERTEEDE